MEIHSTISSFLAHGISTVLELSVRPLSSKNACTISCRMVCFCAAAIVFSVFKAIHELGIARFLREDAPLLNELLQEKQVKAHMLSSAQMLFEALREANIRFTVPDETVASVIQLLYLSILNFGDLGENYFPALYEIVAGACDRLVA